MNAANDGVMLKLVQPPLPLWTLATISETIAHVRQFDAGYADYMAKRYARFLPNGEYA